MRYQTIYFDLDGTLTDPGLGITNSVMYALEHMGRPVPEREALYSYIGPPLSASFAEYAGMTGPEIPQAIALFREYFGRQGKFENQVYPGIPELLACLRAQGKTLVLATSKLEKYALEILEHYGLAQYFSFAAGSTADESRSSKASVLAYALDQMGREGAVMVGDREHDVIGAKANKIPCVGVLFGYGSRQELETAGAARIAATVEQLKTLLEE